jgi:alkylated DNA nucleotide flippase Atl1
MGSHTSPPNQQAFYEQVWSLVRQVPRGKVVTYGQIAQMLPLPEEMDFETYQALSPRWVGSAMAVYSKDRTSGTPTTPTAHNLPPI